MYHISPQEFTEHVRLSDSWSDLARRCGASLKFGRSCTSRCVLALKQKVLGLRLDTQHFTSRNTRPDVPDDAFRGLPDAVDDNVLAFVAQVQSVAAGMRGSYTQDADGTVLLPWTFGDDFDYQSAQRAFRAGPPLRAAPAS
jgi:hypothetical protein